MTPEHTGESGCREAALPITETVELEGGGEITIQRFWDGTHRLTYDSGGADGVHIGFPVTSRDVQRVREATGALVLAGRLDVLR